MSATHPEKLTILDLAAFKTRREPIAMVTAYDYPSALFADRAGIDVVLVGDSIGNNVLGYPSTLPVTMDEMTTHCRAVTAAVRRAFVVGDMPYMSYQPSVRDAILNAGRLMSEGSVDAVKLEGGASVAHTVRSIVDAGIPVMAHVGLTPQSAAALGGLKVQGRQSTAALRLLDDAVRLEDAGAFAVVLEAVPSVVAEAITSRISIPTIGIGAGVQCNGQVLVMHDMFGLTDKKLAKLAKQYVNLGEAMQAGFAQYCGEVKSRAFPDDAHSYTMGPEEEERFQKLVKGGLVQVGPAAGSAD